MALPVREITLAEALTFTRASKAWYFDSNGVHQEAAVDAIREDHDPGDSNARQGIALEGASTNLLTYSEDLSNAVWTKSGATIGTPVSFATNISLDELVEGTNTGFHFVRQAKSVTAGATATFSFLAKANARGFVQIYIHQTTNLSNRVSFAVDLSDGSVDSALTASGIATSADSSVVSLGGGVYRISVTGAVPDATSYTGRVDIGSAAGTYSYTGDGTSSLYIGAAQLEELPFASSYIPTATAQVTRAAENAEVADLAPWYRAGGYAFEYEIKPRGHEGNNDYFLTFETSGVSLTTNSVSLQAVASSLSNIRFRAYSSGILAANLSVGSATAASVFRVAARVQSNDFATSLDGAAVVTDETVSLPAAATSLHFGSDGGGQHMYGWLRDFQFVTDPVLIASDYDDAGLALRSAEYA